MHYRYVQYNLQSKHNNTPELSETPAIYICYMAINQTVIYHDFPSNPWLNIVQSIHRVKVLMKKNKKIPK